jgi:hypothetical protein
MIIWSSLEKYVGLGKKKLNLCHVKGVISYKKK